MAKPKQRQTTIRGLLRELAEHPHLTRQEIRKTFLLIQEILDRPQDKP